MFLTVFFVELRFSGYYRLCSYVLVKNLHRLRRIGQRGRGQWNVYYTSPQSFLITFSYSIAQQLWGLLLNFFWLFQVKSQLV